MTRQFRRTRILIAAALIAAFSMLPASAANASDWRWSFIPYLWGSDITMDLASNGEPVGGIEIGFSDLLDKLDVGFLGHLEGRKGKGGFFLDVVWLDLGKTQNRTQGGIQFNIVPDLGTTMVELGGIYNPRGDGSGVDFILGVRNLSVDQQVDIVPLNRPQIPRFTVIDSSSSYTDGLVGFRYKSPLSSKWGASLRADYSAGDTEGALNGVAIVEYRFGQDGRYGFLVGYRHFELELEETDPVGDVITTDIEMSGFLSGFRFSWGG